MSTTPMTRRAFAGALAAGFASSATAADDWVELFNGHSLEGWRPSENKASWKVVDGQLAADGPRSHLFYEGPVHGADFRNFELEVEAMARPLCNSGVHFHTKYQETDFPVKGFEVQIDNTYIGAGSYRERKKGGSLYGIRNVYKQFVQDNEWFKIRVAVRGKNVQVRLNDMLLVDYVEPTPPVIPAGHETERFLDHGTFSLQCHNETSYAFFRSVRVRPLPDNLPTPGEAPVVDDLFRQIIELGRANYAMVDYHVHTGAGLTVDRALTKSRRDGFQYGIVAAAGKNQRVHDDATARTWLAGMKGQPVFLGLQASGRDWTQTISRATAAQFDYILTEIRLGESEEAGAAADPQKFMDALVERTVGVLEREPVDILANPGFLPPAIAKDFERLWTEERRKKVIAAAAANGVAIELNERYKLPGAAFVRMAKAAGCKFSLGSDNAGAAGLGRCEYGIGMIAGEKLASGDFFVPGALVPKAVDRKPSALDG